MFGSKMKHSLICPNQCRVPGLSLCDDSFDPNRDLGIEISERGIIIPFKTHGTIVRFKTRTPTQNKIENCPIIELIEDGPLEPDKVYLHPD